MKDIHVDRRVICEICGSSGCVYVVDTYKSTWYDCQSCGCAAREQKVRYPYEGSAGACLKVLGAVPKLNGFLKSLARKEQGVDFYRYYSKQLQSPDRGPWAGQSDEVSAELRSAGLLDSWKGKRVLEISGEPGYFAYDLAQADADVLVSAFAEDVARAMRDHLGLETFPTTTTQTTSHPKSRRKAVGHMISSSFDSRSAFAWIYRHFSSISPGSCRKMGFYTSPSVQRREL